MFDFLKNKGNRKSCNVHIQAQRYKTAVAETGKFKQQFFEEATSIPWKSFFAKLLRLILGGVALALVLWSAWTFRQYNQLPIGKVQIIATYEHIAPQSLQSIISKHLAGNFFDLDVIDLKQSVLDLPWVQDVFIRRKWPDTIAITIKEQQPVAQWKEVALLGSNGALFTPPKQTFPIGLPLLLGPEETVKEVVETYQNIQKILSPLALDIIQLSLNDQRSWSMILRAKKNNSSVNVFLGNENIIEKLQNFTAAYPTIMKNNTNRPIAIIDLRYKDGVAVRWADTQIRHSSQ